MCAVLHVQVTSSAYLASVAATEELVSPFSPANHRALPAACVDVAIAQWSQETPSPHLRIWLHFARRREWNYNCSLSFFPAKVSRQ